MAEQSYIFDFSRVPTFFEHMNACSGEIGFKLSDMDGTSENFQIVLVQSGGDNISDYLDSDGLLDVDAIGSSEIEEPVDCILLWDADEFGDAQIKLGAEVRIPIGQDRTMPLKAIFLQDKETSYVMGYSINMVAIPVTNVVVFDEDVIFWDIARLQ